MITVLHRGGYAQMITILHGGGGSLGTPKIDYVICARPLSRHRSICTDCKWRWLYEQIMIGTATVWTDNDKNCSANDVVMFGGVYLWEGGKAKLWLGDGGQLKDVPHNTLLRLGLSLNVCFQAHCWTTISSSTPSKKGMCTEYLHFDW